MRARDESKGTSRFMVRVESQQGQRILNRIELGGKNGMGMLRQHCSSNKHVPDLGFIFQKSMHLPIGTQFKGSL